MQKFKELMNFKKPIIEFNEKKYIFSIRSIHLPLEFKYQQDL